MATNFDELDFQPHPVWADGIQAKTFFSNGYGASVVRGEHSYGGRQGLYELAVAKGRADEWSICYTTPITDDVAGSLSESDVTRLLGDIAALAPDAAA